MSQHRPCRTVEVVEALGRWAVLPFVLVRAFFVVLLTVKDYEC
jgi:hypothetical protein